MMKKEEPMISIFNIFNTDSLATRDSVQLIDSELKKEKNPDTCYLDFSSITQVSRSFMDEISRLVKNYKQKNKDLILINMNDFVSKMYTLVTSSRHQSKISSIDISASQELDLSAL